MNNSFFFATVKYMKDTDIKKLLGIKNGNIVGFEGNFNAIYTDSKHQSYKLLDLDITQKLFITFVKILHDSEGYRNNVPGRFL